MNLDIWAITSHQCCQNNTAVQKTYYYYYRSKPHFTAPVKNRPKKRLLAFGVYLGAKLPQLSQCHPASQPPRTRLSGFKQLDRRRKDSGKSRRGEADARWHPWRLNRFVTCFWTSASLSAIVAAVKDPRGPSRKDNDKTRQIKQLANKRHFRHFNRATTASNVRLFTRKSQTKRDELIAAVVTRKDVYGGSGDRRGHVMFTSGWAANQVLAKETSSFWCRIQGFVYYFLFNGSFSYTAYEYMNTICLQYRYDFRCIFVYCCHCFY